MSWRDYTATTHTWPYVLRLQSHAGVLAYVGVGHTYDPGDRQIGQIVAVWDELTPTLAFNEGGEPPVATSVDEAVRVFGEAGLVRWLAARDHVHVATHDLSRREQADALRTQWPDWEVKAFLLQRALLPCEERANCGREGEFNRILPIIENDTAIDSSPRTWTELQSALTRLTSPVDVHRTWFDPTASVHPFNELARYVEDARDHHMIAVLLHAVRAGGRVFAVAGGSHVVRQERALRSGLRR